MTERWPNACFPIQYPLDCYTQGKYSEEQMRGRVISGALRYVKRMEPLALETNQLDELRNALRPYESRVLFLGFAHGLHRTQ